MDKELGEKLDRIIELLEDFSSKLDDIYDVKNAVESVELEVANIAPVAT